MRLSSKQKVLLFTILFLIAATILCVVLHKSLKKKPAIVKLKVQQQKM